MSSAKSALALARSIGGGVWALLPGLLRALRLVNETISTLLLNYIAPLIVSYFIFGPWRSPESASYPQSPAFVDAGRADVLHGATREGSRPQPSRVRSR